MYEELEKYLINTENVKLSDIQKDKLEYLNEKFLDYFKGKSDSSIDGRKLEIIKKEFNDFLIKSKIKKEPEPLPRTYRTVLG